MVIFRVRWRKRLITAVRSGKVCVSDTRLQGTSSENYHYYLVSYTIIHHIRPHIQYKYKYKYKCTYKIQKTVIKFLCYILSINIDFTITNLFLYCYKYFFLIFNDAAQYFLVLRWRIISLFFFINRLLRSMVCFRPNKNIGIVLVEPCTYLVPS